MKHKHRILADRLIATPAAFVFNVLARILGFVLRRNHSTGADQTKTIVIAKLVGLGSLIQATPLIRSLRQHYPGAKIICLTLRGNGPLVERFEHVDQVITLDDSSLLRLAWSTLSAIVQMARVGVDEYFDLEIYSGFASIVSLLSLSRNRIGFYRHSIQFKHGIYTHLVYFNTRMPIRVLYLQLAQAVGLPIPDSAALGQIRLSDEEKSQGRQMLHSLGGPPLPAPGQESAYLVVNPNASDLLLERRWPRESLIKAITTLASFGVSIVLIGSRSEKPYVDSIMDGLSPEIRCSVTNTAGIPSLVQLTAIIAQASAVLTNDTGPMHIAFAFKRPTVCLFGPVDPAHYGMTEPFATTLYAPVICSPCVHEIDVPPCKGDNVCMQRLDPDLVVDAVRAALRGDADAPRRITLPLWTHTPGGNPLGVVTRLTH